MKARYESQCAACFCVASSSQHHSVRNETHLIRERENAFGLCSFFTKLLHLLWRIGNAICPNDRCDTVCIAVVSRERRTDADSICVQLESLRCIEMECRLALGQNSLAVNGGLTILINDEDAEWYMPRRATFKQV